MPSGGCRRTSCQTEEGYLQPRAVWEYRWVDCGMYLGSGQMICFYEVFCIDFTWYVLIFYIFQAHWWAVLLMGIALIMLMAGFIKICSVHTPSSNPKLPPPKPLPGKSRDLQRQLIIHAYIYLYNLAIYNTHVKPHMHVFYVDAPLVTLLHINMFFALLFVDILY